MVLDSSLFMLVNVAVILIIALCIIVGYSKGLVYEVLSILSFGISVFLAYLLSPVLADHFILFKSGDDLALNLIGGLINHIIWFILILVIVNIIFSIILLFAGVVSKLPIIGKLNKILGAVMGAISGLIWVLVISLVLSTPLIQNGKEVKEGTVIRYINNLTDKALVTISEHIDIDSLTEGMNAAEIEDLRNTFDEWLSNYGTFNE